ncbi:hypothetical protein CDAR_40951 [Caerostris darwini]|uniref:Uncharacterized protein n=1 Tax=Caerostris darwini TaxID=1538125 RepID=A0AAV4VFT3_9ARAC|nr:hypothetical protein CDAR_40951 [Caerostris darwini]
MKNKSHIRTETSQMPPSFEIAVVKYGCYVEDRQWSTMSKDGFATWTDPPLTWHEQSDTFDPLTRRWLNESNKREQSIRHTSGTRVRTHAATANPLPRSSLISLHCAEVAAFAEIKGQFTGSAINQIATERNSHHQNAEGDFGLIEF